MSNFMKQKIYYKVNKNYRNYLLNIMTCNIPMLIHKFLLSYGESTKLVKEAIFILKGGKKKKKVYKHYKKLKDVKISNCFYN